MSHFFLKIGDVTESSWGGGVKDVAQVERWNLQDQFEDHDGGVGGEIEGPKDRMTETQ